MVTSRLGWNALTQFLTRGCAVVFGACALVELAQAQYVVRPTPPTPPVFNPSTPYTVPQPSYTPIAPSNPGYVVGTPAGPPLTSVQPHRRTSAPTTRAAERRIPKTRVHRSRAVAVGPAPVSYSAYDAPFGYGYGCAWVRAWDGHWFRTSPCS
ncbi:MAG: hypothetical protein ACTHJS_15525 [Xanthobacteraceae bacterium]